MEVCRKLGERPTSAGPSDLSDRVSRFRGEKRTNETNHRAQKKKETDKGRPLNPMDVGFVHTTAENGSPN